MPSPWQLTELSAQLSGANFAAQVALEGASPGLARATCQGKPLPIDSLLSVELLHPTPAAGISAYVREGDLVATFEETSERRLRVQSYWRTGWASAAEGLLAGVDLEVSVQTSLLDSDPRLTVGSVLRASEVLRLHEGSGWQTVQAGEFLPASGTSALLFRLADSPVSYFEMTHPSDFRAVQVVREGDRLRVIRPLFDLDLEKGVILRSRIRGGLAARAADQAVAQAAWRAFADSPVPLTT